MANGTLSISMPRGDMRMISFSVTNESGETPEVDITDIFFTVKKTFSDKSFLFQKRLSSGDIEKSDEDDVYFFTIEPEDTDDLKFGDYVFDIELVGPELKDTTTGVLSLTYESTHAANEGD